MGRLLTCLLAILIVLPIVGAIHSSTQITAAGTAWFDCNDSWASIEDESGNILANGSDFTIGLDSGNHTVHMGDNDECQGVMPLNEELPNLRPAPSSEFFTLESEICPQDGFNVTCDGEYTSGDLINDSADVFAINVSSGSMLVLSLVASSTSIDVDLHFQNLTHESAVGNAFSLPLNTSIDGSYVSYIPIENDGRIIVTITSPSPDTIWSMRTEIFDTTQISQLYALDSIFGIGNSPLAYTLDQDESLIITQSATIDGLTNVPIRYRYVYANSESEWSNATLNDRIHGIGDTAYIEFQWDCNCSWMASMSHNRHFDANWGMDAPTYRPLSANSNNSTYPLIIMDGQTEDGELTLHMGDYQDILRVETTGWNESIHLVDVIVEGDIYEIKVTIWDMDQQTWDVLNEVSATYSMDKISLSLDVGLGTHFIKIEHINGSSAIDENAESVEWNIRVNTAVIDEGEEPWFPASEAVKEAADLFYWLIGIILILPFVLFYRFIRKEKLFAEEFASKKNRLQWLNQKLAEGNSSHNDLSRALRAVSSLEWEKALGVWGDSEIRHFTTGIDMAIWSLSNRNEGTWSLLIGICAKECDWNVAAIRFEAPEGEPWDVKKVEPKLLTRGSEIFLDSLTKDSRLFIQVEIEGSSSALDMHLSGMVNGEPMAAKPANTIYRDSNIAEE